MEHDVLAAHLHAKEVCVLKPRRELPAGKEAVSVARLPAIVRQSQWVQFADRFYCLRTEGLYRFWDWGRVSFQGPDMPVVVKGDKMRGGQVIVYRRDVLTLLSSLCMLHVHGTAHQGLSFAEQMKCLKRGVLSLTCGPTAEFVTTLLERLGVKARMVQLVRSLGPMNSYDQGHLLQEVFLAKLGGWVLTDLTRHCVFKRNGKYLSVGAVCKLVRQGQLFDLELITPSNFSPTDTTEAVAGRFDGSGMLGGYMCQQWIADMFHVPLLLDGEAKQWRFYCSDERRAHRVLDNHRYAARTSKAAWWRQFYGK